MSHRALSYEELHQPFIQAFKPEKSWKIGAEAEKFGVYQDSRSPIQFEEPRGIEGMLNRLAESSGWRESKEKQDGPTIALSKEHASVSLEPGGQLEISEAPFRTVAECVEALARHFQELKTSAAPAPLILLGIGFHPFATQEQLPWVPKARYPIMRDYLPTRGTGAWDMMRRTCTVQGNFDFSSEEDALRKFRVAMAFQPVATAMFANSPFVEGGRAPERSQRAKVWLHMDPDRSGLLSFMWKADARFQDYIEWALDAPMFLIKRGERAIPSTNLTFRQFLEHGGAGEQATIEDWELHLRTLFPEVRLKNTLELRGVDSQSPVLTAAMLAFWRGLLYDDQVLEKAYALALSIDVQAMTETRQSIPVLAMNALYQERPLRHLAETLMNFAEEGLGRLAHTWGEADESAYLTPLKALVGKGWSPADRLIEQLEPDEDFFPQVTRLCGE